MKAIRLYAQVLVDSVQASGQPNDLSSVAAELKEFSSAVSEAPLAGRVFQSPMISDQDKQKALEALCERAKLGSFSKRFLGVLVRRGRMSLLPAILAEVEKVQIERKGGLMGDLVSAVPLDPAALSGVLEALNKKFEKPVHLKTAVDPSLIAGMRVTVNGVTYDGTVKSKLARFASET